MSTLTGKIIADFRTSLATAMAIGDTSATLQSATDDDGVALPAGQYYFTLDGDNSKKEHIYATLAGTALTSIKTVSRQGVQAAGVARAHRIGASVVITNFGHLKYINDLITGTTNLNASVPLSYDGAATISSNNQLATKLYVDGVALAGAPDASTVTKGVVEIATDAELAAGTNVGGTGAILSAAGGSFNTTPAANKVPVASASGKLAAGWGGAASTLATLNGSTKVVEDPANATATPTASKIPIASSSPAYLNSWISTQVSSLNGGSTTVQTMVAGENIDASTTPQALYLKESDGKVYKLDATSATEAAYAFIGFAVIQAAVLSGNNILVQTHSVVTDFAGLTVGGYYFGTNTAGAISTTAGNKSFRIGRAITATTLLIEPGLKVASGTQAFSSTTTVAVTLGFRPTKIVVHAAYGSAGLGSNGGWDVNGGNACVHYDNVAAASTGESNAWVTGGAGTKHTGDVTTITNTGFTLDNTKTGAASNIVVYWQAQG